MIDAPLAQSFPLHRAYNLLVACTRFAELSRCWGFHLLEHMLPPPQHRRTMKTWWIKVSINQSGNKLFITPLGCGGGEGAAAAAQSNFDPEPDFFPGTRNVFLGNQVFSAVTHKLEGFSPERMPIKVDSWCEGVLSQVCQKEMIYDVWHQKGFILGRCETFDGIWHINNS